MEEVTQQNPRSCKLRFDFGLAWPGLAKLIWPGLVCAGGDGTGDGWWMGSGVGGLDAA